MVSFSTYLGLVSTMNGGEFNKYVSIYSDSKCEFITSRIKSIDTVLMTNIGQKVWYS